MTANGTQMCYAGLQLTPTRVVGTVWVQWWAGAGNNYSNFFVDGTADGTNWVQIGSHDYGAFQSGSLRTSVDVTDGLYSAIRVRLMPGGYTYGGAGYGGPGRDTDSGRRDVRLGNGPRGAYKPCRSVSAPARGAGVEA
jgi:hypothetical protein